MTFMPKIGKYELQSRVLVAPMSGLTDLPFRRVVNLFNPGLIVSEMVAGRMLAWSYCIGNGSRSNAGHG